MPHATKLEFIPVKQDDLKYGFNDQGPHFNTNNGTWDNPVRVDPYPCYAHEEPRVRAMANFVAEKFPMDLTVKFYMSEFEPLERTNAWARADTDYDKDIPKGRNKKPFTGTIVLAGKRIPLHPAMTRYLVAHEYGHIVQYWLQDQKDDEYSQKMMEHYGKLRGVSSPKHYGSRTWHASIGEMFANDFRILVCGVEKEFWPHAGFTRPEDLPQIVDWWIETTAQNRVLAAQ